MEVIIDFLRKNVNGKTLYTDETTYYLDGGKIKGTYSDQISFSNMYFSGARFIIDMFVVSKEKIIDNETNKEIKDLSSSSLFRYNFAKRQSTGEFTGLIVFIASSSMSEPISAESTASYIYDLKFENNELRWISNQMSYRDQPISNVMFKPVTFKSKCRMFFEGDRLVYENDMECFDVDPKTMEIMPSNAKYPLLISKERTF